MKFIEKLEKYIEWNKSIIEQGKNLAVFDNITNKEKLELTKYIKSSEAGILIEYLGWKKLKNYLPEFLEFLQDANWSASENTAKMLIKAEKELIPHIKKVFNESYDYVWIYWIITLILNEWKKELVELLKPELLKIIKVADDKFSSIEALSILNKREIIDKKEFNQYCNYLLKKYKSCNYINKSDLLKDLEGIMK